MKNSVFITRRIARVATLLLALVLLEGIAAPSARADDQTWIKLLAGPEFKLRVDADDVHVRVPVELTGVRPADVTLRLIDISLNDWHNDALRAAFVTPPTLTDTPQTGPGIEIAVDLQKTPRAGTYKLRFQAFRPAAPPTNSANPSTAPAGISANGAPGNTPPTNPPGAGEGSGTNGNGGTSGGSPPTAGGKPSLPPSGIPLDIQITLPAATLRPLETLVIEQVQWPLPGEATVHGKPLVLRETSDASRLTNIVLQSLDVTGPNVGNPGARLKLATTPETIAPRGSATIAYHLDGTFALGHSTGAFEVNARELAAPVAFNYEIRVRRSYWTLFAMLLLGLASGYFARIVLQRRIELGQAQVTALNLAERLRQELARHPDADFQTAAKAAESALQTALDSGDAARLTQAVTDQDTALRAALDALAARRKTAQDRLAVLAPLCDVHRSLPDPITRMITQIKDRRDAAASELARDNVGDAGKMLDTIPSEHATQLRPLLSDWKASVSTALDELVGAVDRLPASVAPVAKEAAAQVRGQFQRIGEVTSSIAVADLTKLMDDADNDRNNLRDFLHQLPLWLHGERDNVRAALNSMPNLPHPDELTTLTTKLDDFEASLNRDSDKPEAALNQVTGVILQPLDDAWKTAITSQIASLPDRTEIEKLVEARQFAQAAEAAAKSARAVAQANRPAPGPFRSGLESGTVMTPKASLMLPLPVMTASAWLPRDTSPASASAPAIIRVRAEEAPPTIEVRRARTLQEIAAARLGQTVIAWIGVLWVGYLLNVPSYVGTMNDMARIFFWAFGLDVSLNVLLDVAKKIPGASTT